MDLWSSDTLERVSQASQRAPELRRLTDGFLPQTVASTGAHGDWPLAGWAMLSRACGTLDSVMALIGERRATDAGVLVRSLFEQAVTFAWIAIDPTEHALAWVRWDRAERKKAHNDLLQHGGPALLEPKTLQDFEAVIASGPVMPNLAQRAEAADTHWAAQIAAVRNPSTSFRGMYAVIYRTDSQATHAAVTSVEPLVAPSWARGVSGPRGRAGSWREESVHARAAALRADAPGRWTGARHRRR
jgi:Family of unknown function (DUF5677)